MTHSQGPGRRYGGRLRPPALLESRTYVPCAVTFVVDIQCHLVLSCTTRGKHRDATQRRTYTSSRSSGCDQNSPTHHQPSTHEGAQAQLPQSAACNAISPARRSHPRPYHRTPWPHSMENQKVRPQKI